VVLAAANFERADFQGADLHDKSFIGVSMGGRKYRQQTIDAPVEG
jgi:hypothetical protein